MGWKDEEKWKWKTTTMFLCLPGWGDGPNLGGPPLNALATVEICPFNGTLPKRSLWFSSEHFTAQLCINLFLPSLIADLIQKDALLPRVLAFWIETQTRNVWRQGMGWGVEQGLYLTSRSSSRKEVPTSRVVVLLPCYSCLYSWVFHISGKGADIS